LSFCADEHDGFWCAPGQVAQSTTITQTVAQGAILVPAVTIVSSSNITSEHHEATEGFECHDQYENEDFTVQGTFSTSKFQLEQEQECISDLWEQAGNSTASFCQATPNNCKVHCDAHNLHAGIEDGLTDTHCGCFHDVDGDSHDLHASATNPDDDIERRINLQIEKAIGEILSDAINRCISTSLEGCIDLE